MGPRMSNERIDLTKHEKVLEELMVFQDEQGHGFVSNEDYEVCNSLHDVVRELKRCYYEIDLLREYAKCGNCGGRYIGPMDYGLHEWEHSEDCDFFYDNASE